MNLIKFTKKYFSNYKHIKSSLFVPGNQQKMLTKSLNIPSNIIVPDLEDSVPLQEKENARHIIKQNLKELINSRTNRLIYPRVNDLSSGLFFKDIDVLFDEQTHHLIKGLVIPKISTAKELKEVLNKIKSIEKKYNITENIKLIIWIESPRGLINLKEILSLNENNTLIGAAFGAEDFCNEFGINRSPDLKELETARSLFSMTVHAFNLISFDTPYVEFKNTEGLINEIKYVKNLGFKAKFAIHPIQVEIINKYFSPNEKEIQNAEEIIKEFEKALKEGKASINLNGKMVDIPVYKRAINVIERSKN